MPKPHDGESRDDFMERCMSDPEAKRDHPEQETRVGFCESMFNQKQRKMTATSSWLRASISSSSIGVDRKANILRGYVVAQAGPFKSDGRGEFDLQALEAIATLGNAKSSGLKSRFTHPDMSNDGAGKFLGRARNLRLDKTTDARTGKRVDAVRGDLHFDKTALEPSPEGGSKPLGIYVMDLAESDPDALSSSIVVQADKEERLNKDGSSQVDKDGRPLPPLWRPTALHASDIVDTGDAVDGLLSASIDIEQLPLSVLWKGEQLLDAVFLDQPRDVIEARLLAYVTRYLNRKFGEPEPIPATPRLAERINRQQEMAIAARKMLTVRGGMQ